ncbi:MAG: hypothetical protein KDC79_02975 [Cyclobacteriaceae bacterium]|nr:hypothetical protein [Cyclobacteriaceae bacterium]
MKIVKFFLLIILGASTSCTNNTVQPEETAIELQFLHNVNGDPLELDNIKYTNAVGQTYSIKTVKYFISRVTLHRTDGADITIPDIHYVDIRDDATLTYELSEKIPYGSYSGISFVYGLVPEDNVTGSLGLEIDRLMEWPVPMGGGYHYMKLEGDYNEAGNFFNFHSGSLDGVDYAIHVDLPNSAFDANTSKLNVGLVMEISNWFKNPVDWDFAYWGSGIMGNADAQATVQKNGTDVFSVSFPSSTL